MHSLLLLSKTIVIYKKLQIWKKTFLKKKYFVSNYQIYVYTCNTKNSIVIKFCLGFCGKDKEY